MELRPDDCTIRRRPRPPLGLVGRVALVAGVESYLAAHDSDFTDIAAHDWRLTAQAVSREARTAELLCFGTSLLKFGLVPELLERRTGLKTFNLSVLGGQSTSSFVLFRKAIDARARPQAVILDCQDILVVKGSKNRDAGRWTQLRNWPEILDSRDAFNLAWSTRDASLFGALVLRGVLMSLKSRSQVTGASCFSFDLAEAVANGLQARDSRRRWVNPPPFHPRLEIGPLEDIDSSRMAVDSLGRARK